MRNYMVDWCPTLLPEHLLRHAKELVDKFEARLQAQRLAKDGRVGRCLKRGEQAVVQADNQVVRRRRDSEAGLGSKREAGYPGPRLRNGWPSPQNHQ